MTAADTDIIKRRLKCLREETERLTDSRKSMESNSEYRNELMLALLAANPRLTGAEARDFAQRIIQAEAREDYIRMQAAIQKALYGPAKERSAA